MTREEAIEVMKAYRNKLINSVSNLLNGDIEALDMAIKALSQEPCDECPYSTKDGYCQYDDIAKTIPIEQEPTTTTNNNEPIFITEMEIER